MLSMLINVCVSTVNAQIYVSEDKETIGDVEDLIRIYNSQKNDVQLMDTDSNKNQLNKHFLETYQEEFNLKGYNPYLVTKENYTQMENLLRVDFADMGLCEDGDYLIVVGNGAEQTDIGTRSVADSEFNYSYNGIAYRMRYLYVTSADNSLFYQYDWADLYHSNVSAYIVNALNTGIYAHLSAVNVYLGTAASILGIGVSDVADGQSNVRYHAAATWTRVYTQVYSDYYQRWQNGSCVEYVDMLSQLSGSYYSASENRLKSVSGEEWNTVQSINYSNVGWRKECAVISFINSSGCIYDLTDDIDFVYDGNVIITLYEHF